jgi:ArsR family transcriptional regulator
MYVDEVSSLFRLLGDPVRLRLLRLLSCEALNVSELTAVLGIAQSGVSRHLGLLREAGLVTEERTGAYTWYRLAADFAAPDAGTVGVRRSSLWQWLREAFSVASPTASGDDARLKEVLRVRKESFMGHGAEPHRGQLIPGRSWAAWSRALGLLLPPLDVVDLGCGEGYLTIEAARWARHVTAIDRSAEVLANARALANRRHVKNVTWTTGTIEHVPLPDESADVALLSHALHHAADPSLALREAARLLRPNGRVLILELREHAETWVTRKLGDLWLGFSDGRLTDLLTTAGFHNVTVRVGTRTPGDPFAVSIAVGTKDGAAHSNKRTADDCHA